MGTTSLLLASSSQVSGLFSAMSSSRLNSCLVASSLRFFRAINWIPSSPAALLVILFNSPIISDISISFSSVHISPVCTYLPSFSDVSYTIGVPISSSSSFHITPYEGLVSLLVWVLLLCCLSCLARFDPVIQVPQKEHCFFSSCILGTVLNSFSCGLFLQVFLCLAMLEGRSLFWQ